MELAVWRRGAIVLGAIAAILPHRGAAETPHFTKGYGDVGDWSISMYPSTDSSPLPVCTAISHPQPADGYQYDVGFMVRISSTSFILNLIGKRISPARILRIFVDGRLFGSLDIDGSDNVDSQNEQTILAALPGEMLAKQLLPVLDGANTVTVSLNGTQYTAPIQDFAAVGQELAHCAIDAQKELSKAKPTGKRER